MPTGRRPDQQPIRDRDAEEIDRRQLRTGSPIRSAIQLIVSGIDAHDRTKWSDDVTDYFPEADGRCFCANQFLTIISAV